MNVEGKWFLVAGDIPSGEKIPVTLNADGEAAWEGEDPRTDRYVAEGGKLVIVAGASMRMIFDLDGGNSSCLAGKIEQRYPPIEEGEKESVFHDSAMLLRADKGDGDDGEPAIEAEFTDAVARAS